MCHGNLSLRSHFVGVPDVLEDSFIVSGEVTGEEYAFKKIHFIMPISRFYGW